MEAIRRDFGSFDNLRTQMSAKTVAIQGSGWGWLVSEREHNALCRPCYLNHVNGIDICCSKGSEISYVSYCI